MKSSPEFLEQVKTVLKRVDGYKAFVGGGAALGVVLNKSFNDVDIFYTHPMKDDKWKRISDAFKGFGAELVRKAVTDYGSDGESQQLMAEMKYKDVMYQFIWVKAKVALNNKEFINHTLSKFDIDLCKVGFYFKKDKIQTIETTEHNLDFIKKRLTCTIGESPYSTDVTIVQRLPKYLMRFPNFEVDVKKFTGKKSTKKPAFSAGVFGTLDTHLRYTAPTAYNDRIFGFDQLIRDADTQERDVNPATQGFNTGYFETVIRAGLENVPDGTAGNNTGGFEDEGI